LVLAAGGILQAQTSLRWKLKPGDSFSVDTHQATELQVAFSGKSAITKIDLALELTWTVTAATEREFVINQSIVRIQVKLAGQQGSAEFDSAAKTRPTGQARDLASSLQPLIGAEFDLTMTPRGQITAAKPANDSARALAPDEGGAADTKTGSRATIQKLLQQSLVVLPDKEVNMDESWMDSNELVTAAGKVQQKSVYHLAGKTHRGEQESLEIQTTTTLEPHSPVKEHAQSGKILFSAEDGRLVESERTQKLITERPYRETTIVVTLSSKQKTTMTPKK
jgi:hypothetical protein